MLVTLKVSHRDLSLLAELASPEISQEIQTYIDSHVWLSPPEFSLGRGAGGILAIAFRGFHWRRRSREPDGAHRAVERRTGANDSQGHTREAKPPFQIFANARNLNHGRKPIPAVTLMQAGAS